jgi:hypothetical protein
MINGKNKWGKYFPALMKFLEEKMEIEVIMANFLLSMGTWSWSVKVYSCYIMVSTSYLNTKTDILKIKEKIKFKEILVKENKTIFY